MQNRKRLGLTQEQLALVILLFGVSLLIDGLRKQRRSVITCIGRPRKNKIVLPKALLRGQMQGHAASGG